MTLRLVPCPSCSRHIRATEATCPFCAALVPEAARVPVPLPRLGGRSVSRAALFLATAAAVAACGKETKAPPDAGAPDAESLPVPAYGQAATAPLPTSDPPTPELSDAGGTDAAPFHPSMAVPPYGGGPTFEKRKKR